MENFLLGYGKAFTNKYVEHSICNGKVCSENMPAIIENDWLKLSFQIEFYRTLCLLEQSV